MMEFKGIRMVMYLCEWADRDKTDYKLSGRPDNVVDRRDVGGKRTEWKRLELILCLVL